MKDINDLDIDDTKDWLESLGPDHIVRVSEFSHSLGYLRKVVRTTRTQVIVQEGTVERRYKRTTGKQVEKPQRWGRSYSIYPVTEADRNAIRERRLRADMLIRLENVDFKELSTEKLKAIEEIINS